VNGNCAAEALPGPLGRVVHNALVIAFGIGIWRLAERAAVWLGSIGVRRRGVRQRVAVLLARKPGSGRDVNGLLRLKWPLGIPGDGHGEAGHGPRSVLMKGGCCLGGIRPSDHQRLALA
jgi:hypothetical protein